MAGDRCERPVVLVVEDEPILRIYTADTLEDAGFMVIEAADADEAVRILESRSDIRLVVTDVQMPGSMDGIRLAAMIRNRWPPIALVVTSGIYRPQGDLPPAAAFVAKPYDRVELLKAANSAVGRGSH